MINPIIVLWYKGSFHSNIPCLGDPTSFVHSIIKNEELEIEELEVYLYGRKEWIELLQLSKNKGKTFLIEKEEVKLFEDVESVEKIKRVVDWKRESNLGDYYSLEELQEISENKQLLSQGVDFKDLPHTIKEVKVDADKVIKESKLVKAIRGTILSVEALPIAATTEVVNGEQPDSVQSPRD